MTEQKWNLKQDSGLAKDIAKAVNGEYSAITCYGKLIEMAPTERERNLINEIRNDEIRHFHEFYAIYMLLTNTQPIPQVTEQCPEPYTEGLRFAFHDEQETVDVYLDIADRASHPFIRDIFRRAAADEQNHAVWFLSFMGR
ncbi:MAG TPA: ferritin-like domain-containing protein [Bacillaceae bacterium]